MEANYAKIPSWMSDVALATRIVGGTKAKSPIPWQVHVHINRTDNGQLISKFSFGVFKSTKK